LINLVIKRETGIFFAIFGVFASCEVLWGALYHFWIALMILGLFELLFSVFSFIYFIKKSRFSVFSKDSTAAEGTGMSFLIILLTLSLAFFLMYLSRYNATVVLMEILCLLSLVASLFKIKKLRSKQIKEESASAKLSF